MNYPKGLVPGKKPNKERVFRHMARDTPEYKVVRIDRDDLLDDLDWREVVSPNGLSFQNERFVQRYLGTWIRFAKIKYGDDVPLDIFVDFDIDFNRYWFGGRILPKKASVLIFLNKNKNKE